VSGLPAGTRVVLLDIEGTTTRIGFVQELLFTYARTHLDRFLTERSTEAEVCEALDRLEVEHTRETPDATPPPWRTAPVGARLDSAAAYIRWLMDRDRKSPALKLLQGLIWEEGYQSGALRGEVFDDVPRAFERWRAAELDIAIYSSGSQLAQRRLFQSTSQGDLTTFIRAFFDTGVGPKVERSSYERIAAELEARAESILFVSDVTRELEAARAAGFRVRLCMRPGNLPQPGAAEYERIASFDDL
jgi:enolase-phosphatase E1